MPEPPPETPAAGAEPQGPAPRFPFLGLEAGERLEGDALHRLLGLLTAIAWARLVHDRLVDDRVSESWRRALRTPSMRASAELLSELIGAGKVRAADLLGIVPAESSRAEALTAELVALLRKVGARPREGQDLTRQSEEAAELLADFLTAQFEGRLVLADPASGPSTLEDAARPGPRPAEGPAAFLLLRDGRRQPLHPLVTGEKAGGVERYRIAWDFADGVLRQRALIGGEPAPMPTEGLGDFLLELLLRTGAHAEAREWLKGLSSEQRSELNRRNVLYAGFCHYGSLYLRQGEHQQAVVELEKAVKIRPDLVLPHLLLAQACMQLKQWDRAIDILKKHAVLYNRSGRIFELIGDCYRRRDEPATALKMYEKAAGLNPHCTRLPKKRELVRHGRPAQRAGEAGGAGQQPAVKLEELVTDMTLEAELGLYSGTVRREDELRRLVEVLACRDKRNALIVGDPGVGKTALVEDFVQRLAQGRLPERFEGKKVYSLSVAQLLAGAKFRGQFEERVLELVRELKQHDCIVFIDNLHTIVSAGLTRGGTLDTASLLKPHLLRGELQVIGCTTHDEMRNTIEKDLSLLRCFQVLSLDEPGLEAAVDMVVHDRGRYEAHHRVVLPEAVIRSTLPVIDSCVRERALPDKALDIYDRAGAVVSLRQSAEGRAGEVAEVRRDDVLEVLAEATRIPVARLTEAARDRYSRLESFLEARVIGQEEAVRKVSRVLRAARTGLVLDPRRPKGVFLFVGPTGVGKTELAKAMAELLFGTDERLIRIDMSEYMERINQSRLIGTAPGYVGYNDQNQLTDEVRKNPHSLVLLDEIEKADANMLNLFLQVFDAGRLTDGKGRTVHFDNTTIVMTSNVGTELFSRATVGFDEGAGGPAGARAPELLKAVERRFTPEFRNRIDEVIAFNPLSTGHVRQIARQKLAGFTERLAVQGKRFEPTSAAEELIAREGYSYEQGARNLERTIRRLVLEPLAARSLEEDWEAARVVRMDAEDEHLVFELVEDEVPEVEAEVAEELEIAERPSEED